MRSAHTTETEDTNTNTNIRTTHNTQQTGTLLLSPASVPIRIHSARRSSCWLQPDGSELALNIHTDAHTPTVNTHTHTHSHDVHKRPLTTTYSQHAVARTPWHARAVTSPSQVPHANATHRSGTNPHSRTRAANSASHHRHNQHPKPPHSHRRAHHTRYAVSTSTATHTTRTPNSAHTHTPNPDTL